MWLDRGSRANDGAKDVLRTTGGKRAAYTCRIGPSGSTKSRLRRSGEGEVAIPAYEVLRRPDGLGDRMLVLPMRGVSTRAYGKVIGEMAETVGMSRSLVSRRAAEAAGQRLKNWPCGGWTTGTTWSCTSTAAFIFAGRHVLVARGVDAEGNKGSSGIREGTSENTVVALALLDELVERGLVPTRARLFSSSSVRRHCTTRRPGRSNSHPRSRRSIRRLREARTRGSVKLFTASELGLTPPQRPLPGNHESH